MTRLLRHEREHKKVLGSALWIAEFARSDIPNMNI